MDSVAAQIALGQTHDDVFRTWEDDSVEIFFDLDNSKKLGESDNSVLPLGVVEGQYTMTPFNEYIFDAPAPGVINGLQWFGKAVTNATGYVIEFKFLKTTLGITQDNVSVGFHVAINDDDVVGDYSHIGWTGQAHQEHTYGTLNLEAHQLRSAGWPSLATPILAKRLWVAVVWSARLPSRMSARRRSILAAHRK
jgi:hypothetical protein